MKKILIANRGEIAVRIMRTARDLGYKTVAIFSEADEDAPHVALADEAVRLVGVEPAQTYLNGDLLISAARQTAADAIHPGYGFLSENGAFAQQVVDAGLTWIGPSPEAMRLMGDKGAAKQLLAETAVPLLPGYAGNDQSDEAFAAAAEQIGYPVMVKAAAGGGGRGMRLVDTAVDLPNALQRARSEAEKAFGSPELLLEKGVQNPRHVELQIFGDQHGNIIHLGERDCSIQRRHQKVVEEAPSPAVDDELRRRMGEAAVSVAKVVDYVGAGTVEFLLDDEGAFYFIEMNTRLQVEHPVTELLTGLDLVAWQLWVAEGRPLPLTQGEVMLTGHAIEVRLYAEDADNEFLPTVGTVCHWQPPNGDGIRVDHGLTAGLEITPFYDAMIAKIISWGESREVAQRRLVHALQETAVFGVITNQSFLLDVMQHPTFENGEATTAFISQMTQSTHEDDGRLAALAALLFTQRDRHQELHHWHSWPTTLKFEERMLTVTAVSPHQFKMNSEEDEMEITLIDQQPHQLYFEVDGVQSKLSYAFDGEDRVWLLMAGRTATFQDTLLAPPQKQEGEGDGRVTAPMPGAVMRIDIAPGEMVQKGQTLLLLEAMKMEHPIVSPIDGIVKEVLVAVGQQMQPHTLMVILEKDNP